jgi:hypothetical protein
LLFGCKALPHPPKILICDAERREEAKENKSVLSPVGESLHIQQLGILG